MNESSLSSPLLASSREGSPDARSYNSTEDISLYNESSTPLDYDAADDTISIADDFASKSTAKQTFIHLLKGYVSIYHLCI